VRFVPALIVQVIAAGNIVTEQSLSLLEYVFTKQSSRVQERSTCQTTGVFFFLTNIILKAYVHDG
jgi:hypothetical protein